MTPNHDPETLPAVHLVILAAGTGSRARSGDSTPPKQFREVGGRMVLMWSVAELTAGPPIASLTVAVAEPWQAMVADELDAANLPCPYFLAPAGTTRCGSTVSAAEVLVAEVGPAADDLIAVHDAARPRASRHLMQRVCAAAAATGAAIPGILVPDTIVSLDECVEHGDDEFAAVAYLERARLRAVQTPQVFRWEPFLAAHRWCRDNDAGFTDDGGLLAVRGLQPAVVMGEPENWKVTLESDIERLRSVVEESGGG